ncbi:hypothetical protein CLCR_10470 [Cladophialophora carrionii]|uniref:Uncharacterized protein n=1 Tax=Cladophialophora carrionii TaxID=86049 RepID=A0A1C1CW84_9EURO|nr:hypothetical protein CLCR_10470 [Cladophialophora carrionii]
MDQANCQHLAWLEFVHARVERRIICHQRLQRLANQLPNKTAQAPSIALLLGRETKDQILRDVLPKGVLQKKASTQTTTLNLHADTASLNSQYPIYYAELDPLEHTCDIELGNKTGCHVQQHFQVSWPPESQKALLDAVISRLLFLFTDVVCLFADDLGGFEATRRLLTTWARLAIGSHTGTTIQPHVLVVYREPEKQCSAYEDFFPDLNREVDTSRVFAAVKLVRLPQQYQRNRRERLKFAHELHDSFHKVRGDRMEASMLFVATHQAALFQRALSHVTRTAATPFNFVKAARQGNEVSLNLIEHTENVLKLSQKLPSSVVVSVIASSAILDAYPRHMHGGLNRLVGL